MPLDPDYYHEYPAFQDAIKRIHREYDAAEEALYHRSFRFPFWETFRQDRAALEVQRDQALAEARQQYQVPLLQAWNGALQETGHARFHPPYAKSRKQMSVTLDVQEDASVFVSIQITCIIPTHMVYEPSQGVSSVLPFDADFSTWEAVTPEQREAVQGKDNA